MADTDDNLLSGYTGTSKTKPAQTPPDGGSRASAIVGWIVGVVLIAFAIVGFLASWQQGDINHGWLCGPIALGGVIVLPPTTRGLRHAMPFLKPVWAPPIAAFATFFVTAMIVTTLVEWSSIGWSTARRSSEAELEAAGACREMYEKEVSAAQLEGYQFDHPIFRGMVWDNADDRELFGSTKCIVIPKIGATNIPGSCKSLSPAPRPPADVLACAVFNHPSRGWTFLGPAQPN